MASNDSWVIILAGGEGRRLHALTRTASGEAVPKQFCSLWGTPLLQRTVRRARAVAPYERICVVLTEQHGRWWRSESALDVIPPRNLIVEPRGRGTGIGVLTALLHIAARDREARVVALPSDQHITYEPTLTDALREAERYVDAHPDTIVLLGMEPDAPDTELGYIVPGRRNGWDTYAIERIVEKPAAAQACALIQEGALWNSFLLVARVRPLLNLYQPRFAELTRRIHAALCSPTPTTELQHVYESLPNLDFSSDILQSVAAGTLRVLAVPQCGWSDIGTPKHLTEMLDRNEQPERSGECPISVPHVDAVAP